jgi:hypothetical protein
LGRDQPLRAFPGLKYSIVRSSSSFPGLLSTQPNASASVTASS